MGATAPALRQRRRPSLLPAHPEDRAALRLGVIRVLVAGTVVLGLYYLVWRWTSSVNMGVWWLALPLVLAETYSFVDGVLFGTSVWKLKERGAAPPPPEGATVDVFITTYNEPIELVMETALAALAIRHPHRTWILDDGAREEMRAAAEGAGIGYITRTADWQGMPRHAKAGNLNNALFQTDGEYLMVLDADQIPTPEILDKTLGWFRDPKVALVQTPQYFVNVPEDDPLGSQAPLFYGPIQQGKDGWNAAFFCGSNAVLRREALMMIGISGYVDEVEHTLRQVLRRAGRVLRQARRAPGASEPSVAAALGEVAQAVKDARSALRAGEPYSEITYDFQRRVDAAARSVVAGDLEALQADLAAIAELGGDVPAPDLLLADEVVSRLADREWSPLGAIESVQAMVRSIDVDRSGEAQPVMPMATISVTEDMATAMRIHAGGWRSVYHHETLAHGLAPEDLGTMLTQRLRWAQGTLQVMLRENPLTKRGLSAGQKLMYLGTMWSYLSGFAALAYIAAPILFLCFGIRPVSTYGEDFLWHLVPFLVVNQLLFLVVGWGVKTWRGQQYSLALFPIWIRSLTTAVGNVVFGRSLGFAVTPKTKQEWTPSWGLIRPQLIAMGLLVASVVIGLVRLAVGWTDATGATMVNIVWVVYDLVVLSVIVDAALYRGFEPQEEPVP
jgi:cellulose synthase (UDP-forming)